MTERDDGGRWWIPAGVFLVALAVRAVFLLETRDAPVSAMLFVDSQGYADWASRIAAGDWVGSGVFYQAPLYPYFLGAVYALLGAGLATVRAVQVVLGSISCALLALAAARFTDRRTGVAAGLILALSPAAIFSDTLVQKSVLDVLLVCAFLLALSRAMERLTPARWLAAGVALALLMLSRENAAAFVPVLAACIVAAGWRSSRRRLLVAAVAAAIGMAVVLVPVGVRNKVAGGEFFLTTSQFGTNLYIGNNPQAIGIYQPLRYGREEPASEQQDARELAEAATGRRLTPAEVSGFWQGQALDFVVSEPGAWLRLMGRKLLLTVNAEEVPDAYDQYTYADWSVLLRWLNRLANFGVLLTLAAAGIILSWGRRRVLWPLYALAAIYAASVALFYVFSRYRLPLVPLLAPFAALGLTGAAPLVRGRRWRPLASAAAAAGLAALVTLVPLTDRRRGRATMLTNVAHRLVFGQDRSEDAIPLLLEVVRLIPDFGLGHYTLGAAYARTGRTAEALAALQRAVELSPAYAPAYREIGRIELGRRRPESAVIWYERGLGADPRDRETHIGLGKALYGAGRVRAAAAAFERAAALFPTDHEVLANAGQMLVELGDYRAGEQRLEAAVLARGATWAAAEQYLARALSGQGRNLEADQHLREAQRLDPSAGRPVHGR